MDGMENLMPREKMLQYGIETLTDVELLALFLRVGTRRQDVLSYAQFGAVALKFFEARRDQKYGVDAKHADREHQVHPV